MGVSQVRPRTTIANDGAAEAPGGGDESLPQPQVQDRKIVRNATLDLRVENVAAAVQQVEDAAGAAGGFVSSSNVFVSNTDNTGDSVERTQTASVTVRVPADAYASVMSQLRGHRHGDRLGDERRIRGHRGVHGPPGPAPQPRGHRGALPGAPR